MGDAGRELTYRFHFSGVEKPGLGELQILQGLLQLFSLASQGLGLLLHNPLEGQVLGEQFHR